MPWLIQLLVGVLLSAASTLLQQAFAPKQDQQQRTGTRGSAQVGGKVPQYFLVGTIGDPGKFEDGGEWGVAGGVPNAYTTDVHSFGDLPVTGISGLFVNGVRVAIPTTGAVDQGYPVTDAGLSGKFWWKFYDGTQTVADAFLVSKFGAKADRPWTSDKIGRGIPYLITTALWDEKLWTGLPKVLADIQGIKLYDPRNDTTAGGSGSQRWSDPSTWAFSDNNMVIIYNIERGIYYDGAHVWGGKKTSAELPYAAWAAAMDACDEAIALVGGGTEKRFRAGRRIALNERPGDVIRELLIGCNGRIAHCSDGTVYPLVGVPDEAAGSFSDADVLATNALGTIPFPNLDEIINGATATYREPEQAWEDKETAPYLRSGLEAEDDGRQQIEGLDLGTTFSGTQAQRIIKAVIEEGRRFRRHVVALPPEFAQFRVLQRLDWGSDRFDYSAKAFLITARTVEPFGSVIFGLQEVDSADHAWTPAEDEQPLSFAPVVTNRPPAQPMTGWGAAPDYMLDPEGSGWLPTVRVMWSGGLVDVRAVRVQAREAWSERVIFDSDAFAYEVGDPAPQKLVNAAFLRKRPYQVRGIYLPYSGRATDWSGWIDVTTPDVAPLPPGSVDPATLATEIRNRVEGTIDQLFAKLAEHETQIGNLAQVVSEYETEQKKTIEGLALRSEAASASVLRLEEVVLSPKGALAQLTEAVNVKFNDILANGFVRMTAEVNEETGTVVISLGVKATNGEWTAIAAQEWGAQVTVDGAESFIRTMADRHDFISTAGAYVATPFAIQTINGVPAAKVTTLYFDNLYSTAEAAPGVPVIVQQGATGFQSVTIEED